MTSDAYTTPATARAAGTPVETAPLAPGESLRLRTRPSAWFLVLTDLALWALFMLLAVIVLPLWLPLEVAAVLRAVDNWLIIVALFILLWNTLDWLTRAYILTDRRIMRVSGVLRRVAVDVPLRNIQSVTLINSLRERVFGLGTLGVATAGSAGLEFTWFMIARPQERFGIVRQAVELQRQIPVPTTVEPVAAAGGAGVSTESPREHA